MSSRYPYRVRGVIAVLALMALACGLAVNLAPATPTATAPAAAPTQPPFQLPTGIPAAIASSTASPGPAVQDTSAPPPSPEVTASSPDSELMADVMDYYRSGYLPFENGQMHVMDDFSKTRSSINVFDFTRTRQQSQDFALWADIELHTTGSTKYPDYTGCGFAYRVQNNSEGYTAILTNDVVRMGSCSSGLMQCTLFGTTHGTGTVDIPNGTTAQFSLAVNKDHAWVLVDGVLVGQYSLYTTKLKGSGDLYYAAVSNINAGYWTSCKISNVHLWESEP